MNSLWFLAFIFLIPFFSFPSSSADIPPSNVAIPPSNVTGQDLAKYMGLGSNNPCHFPAMFVFGDSYLDAGNNNYLAFNSKANYTPYGIDYKGKQATGRVTNGRLVVDFIAQIANIPFPPAYIGLSEKAGSVRTGISFASASAGVQAETPELNAIIGDFMSLGEQVGFFEDTIKGLRNQFNSSDDIAKYLAKSIFFHHISSNDLGIYWDLGGMKKKYNNNMEEYMTSVSQEYYRQIKRLYDLGARKFVINNVSPMGCMPFVRAFKNITTGCDENTNKIVSSYNQILKSGIPKLQTAFKGSKFILLDFYKIINDIHESSASFGIINVKDSCCTCPEKKSSCIANSTPCKDRNVYLFFDKLHATERVHFLWARRALTDSSISSPMTLLGLIQA